MSNTPSRKKLYSFYIEPETLEKLVRLSGFLTGKGKGEKVSVSSLINMSIDQFLDRNKDSLDAMTKLSESVNKYQND